MSVYVCVCVCVCVCVYVCVCVVYVRARVCVCVGGGGGGESLYPLSSRGDPVFAMGKYVCVGGGGGGVCVRACTHAHLHPRVSASYCFFSSA